MTVALGTKFTYQMALTKGKLTVQINGKQVYSHTPSSSILKKRFYFKYGTYDQTATYSTSVTTSVYAAPLHRDPGFARAADTCPRIAEPSSGVFRGKSSEKRSAQAGMGLAVTH